ncbi:hypothetical protein Fcan01_24867 [Folsomia candida]|uniref:Uncharacterized protein n=1 Tax=Folsomia candida TaxID=158441 RepID=A0A226D427_FOLCA|nr:hypothetical protein Fcan01_24867 [Folsomia candida]
MTTIACDNCCSANNPSNLVGSILLHNSEGEHDGATISISDGLSSLFSYWVGATAPDKLGRLQFCPGCAHIFRKLHKISLQFQNLTKMESQVAKSLAQLRRQGQKITKIIPPPPPPRTFNGQQQQVRRSLRNQNSKETVQPVAKEKRTQKIDKRHVRGQKEGDISFKIKEEEEDICFVQLCEDGPSDSLVFEEVMGETNDIEMDNDAQLESPSNQSEHDGNY